MNIKDPRLLYEVNETVMEESDPVMASWSGSFT